MQCQRMHIEAQAVRGRERGSWGARAARKKGKSLAGERDGFSRAVRFIAVSEQNDENRGCDAASTDVSVLASALGWLGDNAARRATFVLALEVGKLPRVDCALTLGAYLMHGIERLHAIFD